LKTKGGKVTRANAEKMEMFGVFRRPNLVRKGGVTLTGGKIEPSREKIENPLRMEKGKTAPFRLGGSLKRG